MHFTAGDSERFVARDGNEAAKWGKLVMAVYGKDNCWTKSGSIGMFQPC